MTRILTSLVGIPIVIYIIQFAPAVVCGVIVLMAMLVMLFEYFALTPERVPSLFRISASVIATALYASFYLDDDPSGILVIAPLVLLTVALFSRLDLSRAFSAAVFSLFGAFYIGGSMGYVTGVRMIDDGGEMGADLLMMLFVILWAGDIFAYFGGRALGRHKLAPVVSPKKTVEGAITGFIFSIAAAVACRYIFAQQVSVAHAIGYGAVVGLAGQIGDLCESIIKRAAQKKDSGSILPGHGGMLDRLDSLLFGAPAMYYYFYLFLA